MRHAALDWFGSNQVIATLYFPSHLEHLLAQLPSNSTYSLDEIIGRHTMLPLFSRFLPPEHLKKIKGDMQGNNGLALHMRTGTMASIVPLITYLKLCPCCANDDVTRFGEPIRHCRTRQQYIPAKQVFDEFPIARPISDTHFYATLRFIAESTSWLSHQGCQSWDQDAIHEQYIKALYQRDLASLRGRVRMANFKEAFLKFYPQEILQMLECPLNVQSQDNWLARLVRKPKHAQHPLMHLLLMHFLKIPVEDFFAASIRIDPFGLPPWPCLNKTCTHYLVLIIVTNELSFGSRGNPSATFTCICGFSYTRTGPDQSDADRYRRHRIVQFGDLWDQSLQQMWTDPTVNMASIADRLGVDPMTIARQIERLALPRYRPSKTGSILIKAVKRTNASTRNDDEHASDQNRHRKLWNFTCQQHPTEGGKSIRQRIPATYIWLYRHDRLWLHTCPPEHVSHPALIRIDWKQRDITLERKVEPIAQWLLIQTEPLIRITKTAIGRALGQQALLEKHSDKLPKTGAAIAKMTEDHIVFAIRRLYSSRKQWEHMGIIPNKWQLIKASGIERLLNNAQIIAALEAALHHISGKLR